jgi:uncharacterized protein
MKLFKCLPLLLCLCCAYAQEITKEQVKKWRTKAEQGDAEAQCNLGVCYDNGDGVPEDDAEAVKWYRKAADQGYALAQYNLGVCYANGDGVPQDDAAAYMWLNLSHAQGNDTAKKGKDLLAKRMTKEQISEGQKLSREWLERFDKGEKK